MKKVVVRAATVMLIILVSITFILAISNSSEEADAQKAADTFIRQLYTTNAEKVDSYNKLIEEIKTDSTGWIETMKKNDKALRELTTVRCYDSLVANRYNLYFAKGCSSGNCTIQVTKVVFDKNVYDTKKNKAGYSFKVELKLVSGKDQTEVKDSASGYVTLSKENAGWKVFGYEQHSYPAELKKAINAE